MIQAVVSALRDSGISVEVYGNGLRLRPKNLVTPEIIELVRRHKPDLLAYLGPARPAVPAETQEAALKVLHETLGRITAVCEGRQRIVLIEIGELLGHFGEVISGLFARADYGSVPYACLDFERHAAALVKLGRNQRS